MVRGGWSLVGAQAPRLRAAAAGAALFVLAAGCGTERPQEAASSTDAPAGLQARMVQLDAAVTRWREADDLVVAQAAAEEARNLVTGPDVTGYGDLDRDGRVGGASAEGLLPGEGGAPGLVPAPSTCAAVQRDVLGGSWAEPSARWTEVRERIAAWSDRDNTFPGLPSHPQRVVGWATLTLVADDVDLAREYAGHARLHVDVTARALADC